MPRTARLLHILKMSILMRSVGAHPLMVEVEDEQQPKDRKYSTKSIGSISLIKKNRKTASIGSSNENSHKVKNESKVLEIKTQTHKSTISLPMNNRKCQALGHLILLKRR